MNAELSMHLHFVWKPGVRRQGDFKRYFRPNGEKRTNIIRIYSWLIHIKIQLKNVTQDKGINSHL